MAGTNVWVGMAAFSERRNGLLGKDFAGVAERSAELSGEYNSGMLRRSRRALFVVLLTVSLASATLEAQRGSISGAAFRPAGFGPHPRSNFPHPAGRYSARNHSWGGALLDSDFLADDDTFDEPAPQPPVVVRYQREPEKTPEPAQLIEIPDAAGSSPAIDAKLLPPAMFILTSGEKLETRRFVLTASSLTVTVNRVQRTIPLSAVDLDATAAVNQDRGIHVEIPADPNEISLSF